MVHKLGQGRHHCAASHPPPLSSASVGPGRGTLLSRIVHTANQGLLTSLGSRVLSAAHAKTSFRVSSGCPGLRRETPCSGRGQVVKCGREMASGERTAVGCVDTMEGRGMRGSAARMPPEEVQSAVEWHGRDSLQGQHVPVGCNCLPVSATTGISPTPQLWPLHPPPQTE